MIEVIGNENEATDRGFNKKWISEAEDLRE